MTSTPSLSAYISVGRARLLLPALVLLALLALALTGGFTLQRVVAMPAEVAPASLRAAIEQAVLRPSELQTADFFGWSVAIAGDTVVAGAPLEDGGAGDLLPDSGAAYVFVRTGTTWTQQAGLRASDAQSGDQFGHDVAIVGDTVLVGSPWEDGGPGDPLPRAGAVYVFVRSGTTWSEQAILRASDAQAEDWFGRYLALDGNIALVSASKEDGGPGDPVNLGGAVYVFVRSGTTWSEQAILRASDAQAYDNFGEMVAIAGETAVVGAFLEDGGPGDPRTDSGAAYVFVRSGTTWTEQAILRASDAQADDWFGASAAIAGDTILVPAGLEDGGACDPLPDAGAVYVFVRTGTTWAQQAILRASDGQSGDRFGSSVPIAGNMAVVGAYTEDGGAGNPLPDAGAVYVFVWTGTTWTQRPILHASDAQSGDRFGYQAQLAGSTLVVAAYTEDGGAGDPQVDGGAVYVYTNPIPGVACTPGDANGDGGVDAGDVSCTIIKVFGGNCATECVPWPTG